MRCHKTHTGRFGVGVLGGLRRQRVRGREKERMGKWQRRERERRHSLRRHSPPVSVDAVLEVQHGQPPHVHVQHVVVDDVLRDRGKKRGGGARSGPIIQGGEFKTQLR